MTLSVPRPEAKLLVCLYKLAPCLTIGAVLIFGPGKYCQLVSKTMYALTSVPVAKCVVSMLSYTYFLVLCNCSVTMLLFSQHFNPVSYQLIHNITTPSHLITKQNFCSTIAHYPIF